MRTVAIPVYTSKKLELFVEKREEGFELWAVGISKGQRLVIDHSLTRDDLETHLEYAHREDLIWHEAILSEIPAEKHKNAIEREECFGKFQYGIARIISAIGFIDRDRKDTAAAKKAILGKWSDGILTLNLEPNDKLQWSCLDLRYWLNVWGDKQLPNWWGLSGVWELHLMANMNTPKACGTHVGVLHVDEKELHIRSGHLNRIVHVFQKVL